MECCRIPSFFWCQADSIIEIVGSTRHCIGWLWLVAPIWTFRRPTEQEGDVSTEVFCRNNRSCCCLTYCNKISAKALEEKYVATSAIELAVFPSKGKLASYYRHSRTWTYKPRCKMFICRILHNETVKMCVYFLLVSSPQEEVCVRTCM